MGGATVETTGPRMRKTLLHKGGFGSLSNTRRLLSNANKKHGPPLPFGQCWLAHLSPWLSPALGFDGEPSKVFSLLRERLRKGSAPASLLIVLSDAARGHLLPFRPSPLHSGPWAASMAEQARLDLGCVWGLPGDSLLAQAMSPPSDAWNQISG